MSIKGIKLFFLKNFLEFNLVLSTFVFGWLFEWLILFENCFFKNNYNFYFFPSKVPILLVICFMYNIYVWGVSCWRRTQFGKFTRGDRELWAKGLASFWIFEIVTILSIFLVACWLRWGPAIHVPRTFYVGKKWFYVELLYLTYIFWLLYLLKLSMKWNNWENQTFIVYFILFFVAIVIWRDFLVIYGRDYFSIKSGGKWKIRRSKAYMPAISTNMWFNMFVNQVGKDIDFHSTFYRLKYVLDNFDKKNYFDIFVKDLTLIKLLKIKFMPLTLNESWELSSMKFKDILSAKHKIKYTEFIENVFFSQGEFTLYSNFFYERAIGRYSKRVTIWTLLFYIRIWHHLMLIFWWFFFLIRLSERRKSSYTLLSVCHFNLYCCFLISCLIYLYRYLPMYELFFKFFKVKYDMQKVNIWQIRRTKAVGYVLEYLNNTIFCFRKAWSISMVLLDLVIGHFLELYNLYGIFDLDCPTIFLDINQEENIQFICLGI